MKRVVDDLNWLEIKLLIKTMDIYFEKLMTYTKYANKLDNLSSDPHFRKIILFLKSYNILKEVNYLGPSIIIEVNKKLLKEIIPELEIIRYLHDNFIVKHFKTKVWEYNNG